MMQNGTSASRCTRPLSCRTYPSRHTRAASTPLCCASATRRATGPRLTAWSSRPPTSPVGCACLVTSPWRRRSCDAESAQVWIERRPWRSRESSGDRSEQWQRHRRARPGRAGRGPVMICIRCATQNPDWSRFCDNCGLALGRACPTCKFENAADSKFCGGCGGRMAEAQHEDAEGERRQLTVLFCDMVGSTRIAHALDPEDFGQLLGRYQHLCGEAAAAHDGYVSQYLGDGVVIYFGYPRSLEDEPQRAVRCGLHIVDGVTRMAAETASLPVEFPLSVRLGVHTGRVMVGPVGAGDRRDRRALGSAPNVAARLQAEAQPGSLVVSNTTWNIVRGYFHGTSLGRRSLPGLDEPIELWRITGEADSRERVEVAEVLTPFVDRDEERALFDSAWATVAAGASRFLVLRGEPGVGKSRLLRLFRDQVRPVASTLIELRATTYNTTSPFHPVTELIERRLGLDAVSEVDARRSLLAAQLDALGLRDPEAVALLGSLLAIPEPTDSAALDLPPARRRTRTLELLVHLIAALARPGPALLVVEDLHWADSATRDFLQFLVDSAPPDAPLLGLFTSRPDGIPLFVEELTSAALDSGVLAERDVSWEATDVLAEAMIPASVDASLMSRIDRLGASRATAQLAATIGRDFTTALLFEVSDRDPTLLAHDLDRMVGAGLVRPLDEEKESYEFRHALVRDVAYNSLLRTTRQVHHRRVADVLRATPAEQAGDRPDLIARHLTAAGADADAVEYWEAAAHQALSRTAVHLAATHIQAAISCLERLTPSAQTAERELELQILLAPLLMSVHGWGAVEVEQACTRALELTRDLERPDRSYPPMWGLWTVRFLRSELSAATQAAEAVLGAAMASGVPMLEVTGRHALSFTLFSCGEYRRAIAEADAGLALFDLEQERALAQAFGLSSTVALRASRADSLWMLGHVKAAEAEYARLEALGKELGHPASRAASLAFALYGGVFECSYTGRLDGLLPRVDQLAELSRDDDFFLWDAFAHTLRAVVAHSRGADSSGAGMLDGLALWEQAGSRLTLVLMNTLCAQAFLSTGQLAEAAARLDAADAVAADGEAVMAPEIPRLRAQLFAARGEVAAAEAALRTALAQARAQEAVPLELRAALDLADLLAANGRGGEAVASLAAALARCPEGLDRPEPARAAAVLARLATPQS